MRKHNDYHEHHIVPRSMGGSDDPSNKLKIHFIDHAIIHAEDFIDGGPMFDFRQPGWVFLPDDLKQKVRKEAARRIVKAGKLGFQKGSKHRPESIEKLRQNHVGMRGKKHSDATIEKMSEMKRGDRNPAFGRKWWVNQDGERRFELECPGLEWRRGMVWKD